MEITNKLYKNIGVHVISTLFTVDKGVIKVLLVKRTNEPYKDFWALPSGALYNNELLVTGAKRELKEKTGLVNIDLEFGTIFDALDRSKLLRMIGIFTKCNTELCNNTTPSPVLNFLFPIASMYSLGKSIS